MNLNSNTFSLLSLISLLLLWQFRKNKCPVIMPLPKPNLSPPKPNLPPPLLIVIQLVLLVIVAKIVISLCWEIYEFLSQFSFECHLQVGHKPNFNDIEDDIITKPIQDTDTKEIKISTDSLLGKVNNISEDNANSTLSPDEEIEEDEE